MGACLPKKEENLSLKVMKDPEVIPEEKTVFQHESQYIFSKLSLKDLIRSIKSEATFDTLSSAQLKRSFLDLNISLEELTSPDSVTFRLLNKVKNEKKLFELRKLILICILLGQSKTVDKSEWLFRQYDVDASDFLEFSEFQLMVGEIIEVCAAILPVLAIGEGVNSFSKDECDTYTAKLLSGKEEAEKELFDEFKVLLKISHQEFIQMMQDNPKMNFLIKPTLVRQFLLKHSH